MKIDFSRRTGYKKFSDLPAGQAFMETQPHQFPPKLYIKMSEHGYQHRDINCVLMMDDGPQLAYFRAHDEVVEVEVTIQAVTPHLE